MRGVVCLLERGDESSDYLKQTLSLSIYGSTALVDLGRFTSFLILYTVSRTPWTGRHTVERPLTTHRTTQTQNKRTQTSMPLVGFESTIPASKRTKMVFALDRAVTVIGRECLYQLKIDRFK
jgi:hypothetical protein